MSRRIQSIQNYIQELQKGNKRKMPVIIGRRSCKCLSFIDARDLRRVIVHYTKDAKRHFKSSTDGDEKIFRVFPKGMKIRLTFKKDQGLVHIKTRLTNRFFFF